MAQIWSRGSQMPRKWPRSGQETRNRVYRSQNGPNLGPEAPKLAKIRHVGPKRVQIQAKKKHQNWPNQGPKVPKPGPEAPKIEALKMGKIWLIWPINDAFCGLTQFQRTNISPYMLRLKPENNYFPIKSKLSSLP